MKTLATTLALAGLLTMQATANAATTATFDDLDTPPAFDTATGLFFANGDSNLYAGVVWESGLAVGGDAYRVQPGGPVPAANPADPDVIVPPGPLFGIPHSGRYFLTNQGNGVTNDGMLLTTTLVLTGAWFGQNEYYGFGGGADQVTIHALNTSGTSLGFVQAGLPDLTEGEPEVLTFVNTSSFAALTGIAGYRIDRREIGNQSGNWVADDFTFIAAVPEPETYSLLIAGLAVVACARRRRTR